MATVTITGVWLTPAADPTQARYFDVNGIDHSPVDRSSTRFYAGGNTRAVTVPGVQGTATIALNFITDADVAWLRTWQAQLVCYRDARGEKFFGIWSSPKFTPRTLPDSWSTSLTISQVTVSEAV